MDERRALEWYESIREPSDATVDQVRAVYAESAPIPLSECEKGVSTQWFLFYDDAYVLGLAPQSLVAQLRGRIPAQLRQNGPFVAQKVPQRAHSDGWIPGCAPFGNTAAFMQKEVSRDDIARYVRWAAGAFGEKWRWETVLELSPAARAAASSVCAYVLAIMPPYARFGAALERAEYAALEGQITNIRALLEAAGLSSGDFIEGTPWDREQYASRHHEDSPWFISVALEETPSLEISPRDGRCALGPLDVPTWLKDKRALRARRIRDRFYERREIGRGDAGPMSLIVGETAALAEQLCPGVLVETSRRSNAQNVHDIGDLEDLAARLPPCLHSMASDRQFPRNNQRLALVRTLVRGGVSEESARALFHELHLRENASVSERETDARFDVRYYYKKNYSPPYCDSLIAEGQCPLAIAHQGNVEETRAACAAEFSHKMPTKVRLGDPEHLWGPYKWLQWAARRERKKPRHADSASTAKK